MNYRDYLQQLIYKIINPLIRGMIKIGITPNFITTTGFILNVVAAGMFVYAGIYGGQNDLAIIGWGGGGGFFFGPCMNFVCRTVRYDGRTCSSPRQHEFQVRCALRFSTRPL